MSRVCNTTVKVTTKSTTVSPSGISHHAKLSAGAASQERGITGTLTDTRIRAAINIL